MGNIIGGNTDIEKLNLKTITLDTFTKLVASVFKARMMKYDENGNFKPGMENIPLMEAPFLAIGKAGIGKTQIMRSILVENFGLKPESVVELRLGSMQDTDIQGMPVIQKVQTGVGTDKQKEMLVTKFASLGVLPRPETHPPYGILVLDELTTCNQAVRSIALQLLDSSRSIGEYKLPNGWLIVALGNGPDDGGDYEEIKSTIISRCAGYYVTVDWELWYNWAVTHDIHSAVLGYLSKDAGQELFSSEGAGEYDSQLATPRTWEITSDMMRVVEAASPDGTIPQDFIEAVCCSGIGEAIGMKLATFYSYRQALIPMEEIESGEAIQKRNAMDIPVEAMYLGQDMIIRRLIEIAEEQRDVINQIGMRATQLYNEKNSNFDTIDLGVARRIANILEFIAWYGEVDLQWSSSALKSVSPIANAHKVLLQRYLSLSHTKVMEMAPRFAAYKSANGPVARAMRQASGR